MICPVFKSYDDDHKKDLLDIVKEKHSLCSKCQTVKEIIKGPF